MRSLKNIRESMGCNTIRDDHNGGVIYQHVYMDKATFDKMLAEVEEEYSALQAENAKLHKIARLFMQAINDCGCDHCPHYEDCAVETDPMRDGCKMYAEMRELGIEVPE